MLEIELLWGDRLTKQCEAIKSAANFKVMTKSRKAVKFLSPILGRFRSGLSEQTSQTPRRERLIYAIGDIHGRHDLLVEILEKIRIDTSATLNRVRYPCQVTMVFLGDYVDRGYESRQVLESLSVLTFTGTQLIFLKGNHEQAALDFLDMTSLDRNWLKFGGKETLSSYEISVPETVSSDEQLLSLKAKFAEILPAHHLAFLQNLKSNWATDGYLFVHAGIDPARPIEDQSDTEFLWIRDPFLKSVRKLPFIVVHGHTPEPSPVWDGRRIGVDTGAYISNKLTAAKLHAGAVTFLST